MAVSINENNINRYIKDTYPILGVIEVGNNPIDIEGYDIHFYYNENDKVIRITGMITNAKQGKVAFYPRITSTVDVTIPDSPLEYIPFTIPGEFNYSIVRSRTTYDMYNNGDYVKDGAEFVLYDENVHTGLQRYAKIEEKATHKIGMVILSDRAGL